MKIHTQSLRWVASHSEDGWASHPASGRTSHRPSLRLTISIVLSGCMIFSPVHGQVVIPDGPRCNRCIATEVITTLGTAEGPGSIGAPILDISIDNKGRYFVFTSGDMPMLFSPNGNFLRYIGRKGNGPGELQAPRGLWVLPRDSLAIVDVLGRVSVFDSSLSFRRSFTAPFILMRSHMIIQWPTHIVVNADNNSARQIGLPLHVLDASGNEARVVKSFGPNDGLLLPGRMDYVQLVHTISPGRDGGYWTAAAGRYQLTKWSRANQLVATLERQPTWFAQPSDGLTGGPNKPPSPLVLGASEDEIGMIWVAILVPSSSYKDAYKNVDIGRGRREVQSSRIEYSLLYNTRIEVIDLELKRVVAETTLPYTGAVMLPGRRLAVHSQNPDGVPLVQILRLQVTNTRR